MRKAFVAIGLATAIAAVPAAAIADAALRDIMHSWRTDARTVRDMLTGRSAFDEAAIRKALQAYIADAGQIEARVNTGIASGQSLKRHLVGFQTDAHTALADLPRRAALQSDVSHIVADCHACHDVFNN